MSRKGFTLIELSIVLVMIGLIVGGVLVGRDLIKAAEIRATVGQVEKYNAAANTFRIKYNGLPGYISTPASFGFAATNQNSSTIGKGDSNGLIESVNAPADGQYPGSAASPGYAEIGEPYLFWTHLSQANLISTLSTPYTDYALDGVYSIADVTNPAAKIGKGNVFMVASLNGRNYFAIQLELRTGATPQLTPIEAYQIDNKLDDGMPDTGAVISAPQNTYPIVGTLGAGAADNSACYNTTTHAYAIAAASQTGQCGLSLRASF